jgi:hypothetical protein
MLIYRFRQRLFPSGHLNGLLEIVKWRLEFKPKKVEIRPHLE